MLGFFLVIALVVGALVIAVIGSAIALPTKRPDSHSDTEEWL